MTSLDPQFLRAVILQTDFKPGEMRKVKAAALAFALNGLDFTAAEFPAEITNGSVHIAGAACGALVSEGLIFAVDRVKSPDPSAKGRKLNVYRIARGKAGAVRAWFAAQGLTVPMVKETPQMNLLAA